MNCLDTRAVLPQTDLINELDFHWLVGVLEGEGTFLSGPPSQPASPAVRVTMTDRDVVERVGRIIERAVLTLRPRELHHKTPYMTTIKGSPAAQLMLAARPFLGSARQTQLDGAIASWRRNGRRPLRAANTVAAHTPDTRAHTPATSRGWLVYSRVRGISDRRAALIRYSASKCATRTSFSVRVAFSAPLVCAETSRGIGIGVRRM